MHCYNPRTIFELQQEFEKLVKPENFDGKYQDAFNWANWDWILAKLADPHYLVRLIESLLCNKTDDGPEEYIVMADVPQGSVLGLLLRKSCTIKCLAFACQRILVSFEYGLASGLLRVGSLGAHNRRSFDSPV